MESIEAAPSRLAEERLLEYKMQELLLQEVLPQLGLASLAHLRACCRSLQSLLDSELCSDIWFPAAQHHLPGRHQMHRTVALPSSFLTPQQQAISTDSITNHDNPQQQQPEQSHPEDWPALKHPCQDSFIHPVLIQQLLLEHAVLLQSLSQHGSTAFLRISPGAYTSPELWSSCGTWVAMQQHQPQAAGTLLIWNTDTGATQAMLDHPRGHILHAAWLPASSHLVWVKSHDATQEYTQQSLFCLDAASGQKHQLLNQPYRHWLHKSKPIISASGSLLAFVHSESVKLLSLPHLQTTATFASPVHARPSVAAMSFNPAATLIAITWDGQWDKGNADVPPLLLDIFSISTRSRCFSMAVNAAVWCSWNPTMSHLLILSDCNGLTMLDLNDARLTPICVRKTWPLLVASAWTADGSLAIIRGSKSSRALPRGNSMDATDYSSVLCSGAVGFKWTYGIQGPRILHEDGTSVSLPRGIPDDYRFHRACLSDLELEIGHILGERSSATRQAIRDYISSCGRLVVKLPYPASDASGHAGLIHFDVDYLAHSATKHLVSSSPIPRCSPPIWHPSLAGSRIYTVNGQDLDIWLFDGKQHRVLQHWRGIDLLRRASNAQHVSCRWRQVLWSKNGAKLLLLGDTILIAIAFCSPDSLDGSSAPVGSACKRAGLWELLARSLSQLFRAGTSGHP